MTEKYFHATIHHMTDEAILKLIARRMQEGNYSLSHTAQLVGVSIQYLHDVINGHRRPGPKVLTWLGYERKTEIVRAK